MIHGCMNRSDWRRAMEWTEVLGEWINRESVGWFPGLCLLHQAEVERIRGALREAEAKTGKALQALIVANPRMTVWLTGNSPRLVSGAAPFRVLRTHAVAHSSWEWNRSPCLPAYALPRVMQ